MAQTLTRAGKAPPRGRVLSPYNLKRNWPGYLLIAPAVLLIIATSIYPMVNGINMSVLNYDITRSMDPDFATWAGLDNFKTVFGRPEFWQAARNTLVWTLSNVVMQFVLAMLIALALNKKLKGRGAARTLTLVPWAIPSAIAALTFSFLYDSKIGIINLLFQKLGLIKEPISFLGNIETAFPSVIAESIWKGTPFLMIFVLAALQGIPGDVYESASIDGASKLQAFFRITLPMVKEPVAIAVVLNIITTINNFNAIWLLTGGGPLGSTEILYTYAYRQAFVRYSFGIASAVSVIIFVLIVILTTIYIRMITEKEAK